MEVLWNSFASTAEKVRQIRHDIRSPLSSLQSIYENINSTESDSGTVLASAIRRIQMLIEDLNQIDKIREEPKLVIADATDAPAHFKAA